MDIIDIRHRIESLPDEIEKAEIEYLSQKAQLDYMNDLKKHQISLHKVTGKGTNADRTDRAYASGAYALHLRAIVLESQKVAKLAGRFHRLEREFEGMRSLNKNV